MMIDRWLFWVRVAVGVVDVVVAGILVYYYIQATRVSDTFLSAWWCRLAVVLVFLAGWSQLAMAIGNREIAVVAFTAHLAAMVAAGWYLPGSFSAIFQAPSRVDMREIKDRLQREILLRERMEEEVIPKVMGIIARAKSLSTILTKEVDFVDRKLRAAAAETEMAVIIDHLSEINRMLDVRTQAIMEVNLLIVELEVVARWKRS